MYGKADERRRDEALLGARHKPTQAINMFLKRAVREQRISFEVAARPAESMEEQNRLTASDAAPLKPFHP